MCYNQSMHSHAQHFEYHKHAAASGRERDAHTIHAHGVHTAASAHSTRRIFLAFLLSLVFSIIEFIGGFLTGSVAITSDSVHSFGDALSTGISCLFEYLDHRHHHSHERYSRLGAIFTTIVLFAASGILIYEAITRILDPAEVNYDGMIIFALFGILFNLLATLVTRHGHSLNQRSVNLHMLEDCLSWVAVLAGAVVMRLTGIHLIDPLLSLGVATFILYHTIKNTRLLLATPRDHSSPSAD